MFKCTKVPHFKYEATPSFESGTEYLRLYLPAERGFVNYNIIRSVRADAFADIFRLGKAFAYDDNLENGYAITPERAEWDMAIKIVGREDFIGGLIHGDEVSDGISVTVDGKVIDFRTVSELTPFDEMKITVSSAGYDPIDHKTKALLHKKEYTVTENGITSRQSVEFLGDFTLENSYLAMMPPCKEFTDSYFTDKTPTPQNAVSGIEISGAKSATVFGKESGISFTMAVPEYPSIENGGKFFISDNGGRNYNKMYFPVTTKTNVKAGDTWVSLTKYEIAIS
jgi:hypothetical protein